MPLIAKRAGLAVATLSLLCTGALADDLSPAEARGKHIYTKGESTSSRIITATVATSEAPASASILPCIQCHGVDGRGIGIISPDINWEVLVDPDGHEHPQRQHGPFDEETLKRAIIGGVDPAGNALEATMPRYAMADPDMADLIAYLKRIDAELDPGISAEKIRVGTVLPTSGPFGEAGTAMRRMVEAYFNFVNATGGVHGRDLELVVGEYGEQSTPAFWAVQDLVRKDPPFALVGAYLPGYEAELGALVEEQQLPLVGPYAWLGTERNARYEFFLQAGLAEQALALVRAVSLQAVAAQADQPRVAVIYPSATGFKELADFLRDEMQGDGIESVTTISYMPGSFDAAGLAGQTQRAGVDTVVFLGSADGFAAYGRQAHEIGWAPTLLAPGILAESGVFNLPDDFGGQVFLAYASLPGDYTQDGSNLFEALHRDAALDYQFSGAQIAAFSAARVLVEALERTGPMPSRERFVSALETLSDFEPGLSAKVSFAPGRRMGPGGAWVVRVDLMEQRLDADQRWIALD